MNTQQAISRSTLAYYRAKNEFEALDKLSRERALTLPESRALERAIARMAEWGAAA